LYSTFDLSILRLPFHSFCDTARARRYFAPSVQNVLIHIQKNKTITCMPIEGFVLMTGFIELFYTGRDNTLEFTITHTLVSTVTSSLPLLGSGFQRRSSPSSGFPNCPRPQLPASNSSSSQRLSTNTPLSHSPTNSIHLNRTNSTVCLLITSRHGPHRKHSSNSSSTVASRSSHMDPIENNSSQLVHWCVLEICCLATGDVYRVIT
jgi:hypothetical protein